MAKSGLLSTPPMPEPSFKGNLRSRRLESERKTKQKGSVTLSKYQRRTQQQHNNSERLTKWQAGCYRGCLACRIRPNCSQIFGLK